MRKLLMAILLFVRPVGLTFVLAILAIGCSDSPAGPDRVPDPVGTPLNPLSRSVTVAPGVNLHYLDFGGAGEPVLLLTGLGHTANIYRTFAPLLTDDFRVRALTRRGYGSSSQPASGYDRPSLARDILALLDSLGVSKAHLVGHSIAGEEMTRFATEYPTRVGRLVFIDAAFDRTDPRIDPDTFPAWAFPPPPTNVDVASRIAFTAYLARGVGVAFPAAEVSAMTVVNAAGVVVAWSASPTAGDSIWASIEAPSYASVAARSLAIYALPSGVSDVFPWLTNGSADWIAAETYMTSTFLPNLAAQSLRFDSEVANSTVLFIGAIHHLFLTHGAETASAVRAFLLSP